MFFFICQTTVPVQILYIQINMNIRLFTTLNLIFFGLKCINCAQSYKKCNTLLSIYLYIRRDICSTDALNNFLDFCAKTDFVNTLSLCMEELLINLTLMMQQPLKLWKKCLCNQLMPLFANKPRVLMPHHWEQTFNQDWAAGYAKKQHI